MNKLIKYLLSIKIVKVKKVRCVQCHNGNATLKMQTDFYHSHFDDTEIEYIERFHFCKCCHVTFFTAEDNIINHEELKKKRAEYKKKMAQ